MLRLFARFSVPFPSPVWFIIVCAFWCPSWCFYLTYCLLEWIALELGGVILEHQLAVFDSPLLQDVQDSCKHHQFQGWAQCTPPLLSNKAHSLSSPPLPCMAALQPCGPAHHSSVILVLLQLHTNLLVFTPHAACISKDFSALKHL